MATAQVSSVEAVETFRADLLVFLAQARSALEEVANDLLRLRLWLENDQRRFWEQQLRNRQLAVERAQSELFGARLAQFQETLVEKQLIVRRAREAQIHAEEKLKVLRRWERDLERAAEPMLKQIERAQNYLSGDMGRGVVLLGEMVKSLQAYAEIAAPAPGGAHPPAGVPGAETPPVAGPEDPRP